MELFSEEKVRRTRICFIFCFFKLATFCFDVSLSFCQSASRGRDLEWFSTNRCVELFLAFLMCLRPSAVLCRGGAGTQFYTVNRPNRLLF